MKNICYSSQVLTFRVFAPLYLEYLVTKGIKGKIRLLLLLLMLIGSFGFAQNMPNVISPSPNVASIGLYGQVPISFFNGLAQITIPTGKVLTGGTDLDISMNYHGGGIRPDEHGGWTGLGWNLDAGGVITRIVHGGLDEVVAYGYSPITLYSYYNNFAYLDNSSWASYSSLHALADSDMAFPEPDEFMFSFAGCSGSFYYNHEGKWKVKSKQNLQLIVKEELMNDFKLEKQPDASLDLNLKRIFYKFTIITPDGSQYVFGGTSKSIEFSRAEGASNPYNNGVTPTSWFLTKIISSTGKQTSLNYERGNALGILNNYVSGESATLNGSSYSRGGGSGLTMTIINPVYLKEIVTENEKVVFNRSISNEMPYNYYDLITNAGGMVMNYSDLGNDDSGFTLVENMHWQKLDNISFYSSSNVFLKAVAFSYLENQFSRLMLTNLQEIGENAATKPVYEFTYDTSSLPPYNSRKLDHWGFYNGNDFFSSTYPGSNYYESKESNLTLMAGGNLTSIRYPTGGKTIFEYEPNSYSKIAKTNPFDVESVADTQCGGLRIKKIKDVQENGEIASEKEYLYVLDHQLNGTSSSGILAGIPVYNDIGSWSQPGFDFSYNFWHDYSVYPLSLTNGNHVTYTEVVEKLNDDSYTIYNYTNHDKLIYRNKPALAIVDGLRPDWSISPNTSSELNRGLLLKKASYRPDHLKIAETLYEYGDEDQSDNGVVRAINVNNFTFYFGAEVPPLLASRMAAYQIYLAPKPLIKETNMIYDENQHAVSSIKEFTYNSNKQLKEVSATDSKGITMITAYKYPVDFSAQAPYDEMLIRNMVLPIVEQSMYKLVGSSRVHLNSQRTNYGFWNVDQIYPTTVETKVGASSYRIISQYHNYDKKGNLLSYSKENGPKMGYIWAYNGQYPIANYSNSNLEEIFYLDVDEWGQLLGHGTGLIPITFGQGTDAIFQHSIDLASGVGVIQADLSLLPGKTYEMTYWDKESNLAILDTHTVLSQGILEEKGDWVHRYITFSIPSTTSSFSLSANEGYMKSLIIKPGNSQISTYTYRPLVGMTSQTDVKGLISYYEYDDFQRLLNIKNHDRDILKNYRYNYHQFTNSAQSGNFTKNNCSSGQTSVAIPWTIAAGSYFGLNVEAANTLAATALAIQGQANANANGVCTTPPPPLTVYAHISYENPVHSSRNDKADIVVRFYSDAALTQPYTVTNLPVTYTVDQNSGETITEYTVTGSGTSFVLETQALLEVRDLHDLSVLNTFAYALVASASFQIL